MKLHNPFLERLGVELIGWKEGLVEMALLLNDEHGNRSGVAQGGVIATLLDAACGYAGLFSDPDAEPEHANTIMLTISYIAPARLGQRLRVVGRVTGQGRKLYFSSAEVRDQSGAIVASSQGSFKRRSSRPTVPGH